MIFSDKWNVILNENSWEDLKGLWMRALNGLTDDQIKTGIRYCEKLSDGFPPCVSVFRKSCFDFYNETEAFEIAKFYSSEELLQKYGTAEPRNKVLYDARVKAKEVFNKYSDYTVTTQNKKWDRIYRDEINEFLKK